MCSVKQKEIKKDKAAARKRKKGKRGGKGRQVNNCVKELLQRTDKRTDTVHCLLWRPMGSYGL